MLSVPVTWKLCLAVVLVVAIAVSARARAPRRALARAELRRLVVAALALYGVGTLAWLHRQIELATLVYAAGIAIAALAAWLSRGTDSGEPPRDPGTGDEEPPPDPTGPRPDAQRFDWERFERDFRDYADRSRAPAGVSA